jgi:feruloyl esterase
VGGGGNFYLSTTDPTGEWSDPVWIRGQPSVPGAGLAHCGGGSGLNVLDLRDSLEAWVEHGRAPERVMATRYAGDDGSGQIEYSRPLCPFPKLARYDGVGDLNTAESFECVDAERPPLPEIGAPHLR